ncbi:transcriptional regulator [Desulfosporosinus orientis DSM 765]|uniref:Transcriptional regulator n=1 Tax=Desulfosporosinus orientis (strain ATCC 19365 / DSM 765 / NCIMB 8382 / VKM B-1628 / Singapore I) TaxID=768706 RepID=G7W6M2_DESOD|nr:transcriptional regulator [Desulfosporosinus orientis DSM 765]
MKLVAKVDRRILKSQEAIKKAMVELMSMKNFDDITIQDISDQANVNRGTIYLHYSDKFDLLDKLIQEHINELQKMCESACKLDFIDATLIFCEYFDSNYSFFSLMLANKGAPYFRNRFLDFLLEEFRKEADVTKGKNQGLNEDVIVRFVASAYVGVVEWWFTNEKPFPHRVLAEQLGTLLDRIL